MHRTIHHPDNAKALKQTGPLTKKERFILFSSALGLFLYSMDSSLMNLTQPLIGRYFGIGTSEVSFISTAYLVVAGAGLMIFSQVLNSFDFKKVLIIGYSIFLLATIACGLSENIWLLIVFRALQGIGGSILFIGSFIAASKFLPTPRMGTAFGVLSASLSGGMAAGFPLGGLLTSVFSWQSVFFIQIPFIILAVILAWMAFPSTQGQSGKYVFDVPGVFAFFVALSSLTFSLSMGENIGWTSTIIVSGFVLSIIFLFLFILVELKSRNPFIDLKIFTDKTYSLFLSGRIYATILQSGNLFLLPFYLIYLLKLSQAEAGFVMLSYTVLYTMVAPFAGLLADRFKPERVGFAALIELFIACLFFLCVIRNPTILGVMIFLALVSIGFAVFFPSNNKLSILFVPPENRGEATGIMLTIWAIGQSFGVSTFEVVFASRLSFLDSSSLGVKGDFGRLSPDILIDSFRAAYFSGFLTVMIAAILTGIALWRIKKSS